MPNQRAYCRLFHAGLLAVLLLGFSTAGLSAAQTTAQSNAAPRGLRQNVQASANNLPKSAKPLWSELSLAQRQALSPLASEWDRLDATQKQKWLAISEKYASLKPDQQIRLQERMRDWVKLTPDQRRAARENYSRAKKLDSSRKSEKWEQYQQLPEETKKKLAAEAAARNRVANLPAPSGSKNPVPSPKKGSAQPAQEAAPQSPPVPGAPTAPAVVPPAETSPISP